MLLFDCARDVTTGKGTVCTVHCRHVRCQCPFASRASWWSLAPASVGQEGRRLEDGWNLATTLGARRSLAPACTLPCGNSVDDICIICHNFLELREISAYISAVSTSMKKPPAQPQGDVVTVAVTCCGCTVRFAVLSDTEGQFYACPSCGVHHQFLEGRLILGDAMGRDTLHQQQDETVQQQQAAGAAGAGGEQVSDEFFYVAIDAVTRLPVLCCSTSFSTGNRHYLTQESKMSLGRWHACPINEVEFSVQQPFALAQANGRTTNYWRTDGLTCPGVRGPSRCSGR